MSNNTFGKYFCITTWGESHGKAIGVVIDGMPSNIPVSIDEINHALKLRAPGQNKFTSPRKEMDEVEILSGMFDGKTTGAPISLLIKNKNVDSSKYQELSNTIRPSHIDFTYSKKYKNYDYHGGGRGSGRETAVRVAAGVFAKKLTDKYGIIARAYLQQVGDIELTHPYENLENINNSAVFCPDLDKSSQMEELILSMKENGNSIGGIVGFVIENVPIGLGEPIYYKLEAQLASAMLSIPASKGFEIGMGFKSAKMTGEEHNDAIISSDEKLGFASNNSGGVLGGISNGDIIYGRVPFKAPSSIYRDQQTITKDGKEIIYAIPKGSRHDPCLAVRAVKVVEAMCYISIADLVLAQRDAF